MKKVLVVGGGLAGCSLAIHLLDNKCNVTVVDSGINHSSIVAAGMINPLVFRRMTKSWRVDEFIPYATSFYRELEKNTQSSFFYPISIRRFFSSSQEHDFWLTKQNQEAFINYMETCTDEDKQYMPEVNPFGSGRVKQASYVETSTFLANCHQYINQHGRLSIEPFIYGELDPLACSYKNESYDAIVFCEGYMGKENPWFSELPLNQTKGETITVELLEMPQDVSLNRKCFVLPIGNHQFKVGATYVWNTNDVQITDAGRKHLLDNLSFVTSETPKVIHQNAGVRPTTLDRRPLMGKHSSFEKLFVFNGLGTKGYMMAPLLAKEMSEHILLNKEINAECNVTRFTAKSK